MSSNQISAFEYVSILVSIILGLGITQILSSFSDLLYNYKRIKFYWPHTLWVIFVLFLHIQDWFVTYELRFKSVWRLPELMFILAYPVSLFIAAKMLLPTNEAEKTNDMKSYYMSQFPTLFLIMAVSITCSILFNILLLGKPMLEQGLLFVFLATMIYLFIKKDKNEIIHKTIAVCITIASVMSIILEQDVWVIK
jgi:hypothetical protein